MLAAARVVKGAARVPQRALVVAGQRQAAVRTVRRMQPVLQRGIQSIAQTDRVCKHVIVIFKLANTFS